MVIMAGRVLKRSSEWQVAEAKARFSEMIDRALAEGPQVVTRNGKRTVVLVPVEEWERKGEREGSLADFFAASPLRGSSLKLERRRDLPRDIDL
jgi:prevent-host-death family protein